MKKIGTVTKYDDYVGEINTEKGEKYLLLKKEVYDEIKKDDKVTFESEIISISNEERKVARFVKKLKK